MDPDWGQIGIAASTALSAITWNGLSAECHELLDKVMSVYVTMLRPHSPATIPLIYILFNNVSSVDTTYIQDSLST